MRPGDPPSGPPSGEYNPPESYEINYSDLSDEADAIDAALLRI